MLNKTYLKWAAAKYGGTGRANERKRSYYVSQGIANQTEIRDMEQAWLVTQGQSTGTFVDRWKAFLIAQGHAGSLYDMLKAWFETVAAAVVGRFWHSNYWQGNYWHSNYWMKV